MECKKCNNYLTYACPHLFKEENTFDNSECYYGIKEHVTREELIELKMSSVCGRAEYRDEIVKEVMALSDEDVVKEYNIEISFYNI